MTTRKRKSRSSPRKRAGSKAETPGSIEVDVLLDLARPWRTRKLPPPGTSVVYDRHYSDLEHEGFLQWVQVHPHHQSMTEDHYELTRKGHARVAAYRQWMKDLTTPKHLRHGNLEPIDHFRRGAPAKVRGIPKDGECQESRTKGRFTRGEVASGTSTCTTCRAPLTLRRLSPGMAGEPRVSEYIPAHTAPRHHGNLGPQVITEPGSKPGLVNIVMVNSKGFVIQTLQRDLPYTRAVKIIREQPLN